MMGHMLIWIESLTAALLLAALATALAARRRTRWAQALVAVVPSLWPLLVYAACVVGAGWLAFEMDMRPNYFAYSLLLALAYVGGAAWLLVKGLRRDEGGKPEALAWPAGRIAVALGVALALQAVTFWNLDLAARLHVAALRSEAGALALSAAPPRVPHHENAATLYEAAFEAMGKPADWPEAWDKQWSEWIKDEHRDEFDPDDEGLRPFLAGKQPALALLRRAAAMPGCDFDRNYAQPSIAWVIPELTYQMGAARLLALDARVSLADRNTLRAIEDATAIFRMAGHVGNDPLLISTLVAATTEAIGAETLATALATGNLTREALAAIQIDETLSFRRMLARSLRVEEAFGLWVVSYFAGATADPGFEEGTELDLLHGGLGPLYRVFLLADDLAAYRHTMQRFQNFAARPYHEAREDWLALPEYFEHDLPRRGPITVWLTPALASAAAVVARADANHRLARLAEAVARHALLRDAYPEDLGALAPEWITVVPRDPFDREPLRMKRADDGGVILYSIGPDARDDGGRPWDDEKKCGDLVFRLPPVKAR